MMSGGWRNATLAVGFLMLAACARTTTENRRSLFIDQVEPHAQRAQVMGSLEDSGWCVDQESIDVAILHWCRGEPHMRLDLAFQDDELVQASLGVPAVREGDASVWNATNDGAEAGQDVAGPLFSSLGVELRERYGKPRVTGKLVQEWTPSRAFTVSLHRHRMFVVETYTFPRSVGPQTLVTSTAHPSGRP